MSNIISNIHDMGIKKLSARLSAQELALEKTLEQLSQVVMGLNSLTRVVHELVKDKGGIGKYLQELIEVDKAASAAKGEEKPSEPPEAA